MAQSDLKRLFGVRVRDLREANAWTQEALAEKIDRTVDTVSNIERGIYATRIEVAAKIARVFGLTLSELFDWDPSGSVSQNKEHRQAIRLVTSKLNTLDRKTLAAVQDLIDASLNVSKGKRRLR